MHGNAQAKFLILAIVAVGSAIITIEIKGAQKTDEDEGVRHISEGPKNFIFFNRDRERISEASFLKTASIVGAQLKYTWRELEPKRDRYEFGEVLADVKYLEEHGKRLFIQIQDVSFSERANVPNYLINDPEFSGGVARQHEYKRGSEPVFDGLVARRWDPAVIARFEKLLWAIGEKLDGRIEGVVFAETAVGFVDHGDLKPVGFSYDGYAQGVRAIMSAARKALPKSTIIQYANFMPGEGLPNNDKGYLRSIYKHGERIGVSLGGPDLLPHRLGQQNHSLKLLAERKSDVVAGLAVQYGNLSARNPTTGEKVTVAELYSYAKERLNLDFIFWGIEEPYYTKEILPFLRHLPLR